MLCLAQRANELVLEHPANTYSMLPQHTAVVGRLERMHGVLGKVRLLSLSGTTSSVSPELCLGLVGIAVPCVARMAVTSLEAEHGSHETCKAALSKLLTQRQPCKACGFSSTDRCAMIQIVSNWLWHASSRGTRAVASEKQRPWPQLPGWRSAMARLEHYIARQESRRDISTPRA